MNNAKRSAAIQAQSAQAKLTGFRRKRLLGSSSALAAAIAMTAALSAETASAQTAPPMHSQMRLEQNINPVMRDVPQTAQRVNAPKQQAPTQTPNQARNLPTPIATERMMIDRGITIEVPELPQTTAPVSAPAATVQPIVNTVSVGPITAASSTQATTPGDTDVDGFNVSATANYFSDVVDFTPGTAEDVVFVVASEAIINWTTFDDGAAGSTVDFLSAGSNLRFTSSLEDYTVLNRVFTPVVDSAIRIDGSVISEIFGGDDIGGNVWFYSPGGIVVGPAASFDVGSLVLSSSEISSITGTGIRFTGVAEPDTSVIIESGAVIDARDDVVLFAPRIEQGGIVRAGGEIAYIGAEEAQITFTNTLFSISILVGTQDANGIVHTGTTGGATFEDDPLRAITMQTVSQADPVTMLVGGNIGYDDASVATASNGSIFLTAGVDGAPAGNIEISGGAINSTTLAQATGEILLDVDGQTSALTVGSGTQDADFLAVGGTDVTINATSGGTINVFGDLIAGTLAGETGGNVSITVDDAGRNDDTSISGLLVGGDLQVLARSVGANDLTLGGTGGDAIGGTVSVDVSQGGEFFIGGDLTVATTAIAGFGEAQTGSATGGDINFAVDGVNTRVLVTGGVTISADAIEASNPVNQGLTANNGSVAMGGSVDLAFTGGAIELGSLTIDADAQASSSGANNGAPTNDANGGSINFINDVFLDVTSITLTADGNGGDGGIGDVFEDGQDGGVGTGGSITLASSTDLGSLNSLTVSAQGDGGLGGFGGFGANGGTGGLGQGGDATVSVSGDDLVLNSLFDLIINTTGQGGSGLAGGTEASMGDSGSGGAGGAGIGGTSAISIFGPDAAFEFQSDFYQLIADGIGGDGGTGGFNSSGLNAGDGGAGGDAAGGTVQIEARSGANVDLIGGSLGPTLRAQGFGGDGGDGGGIVLGFGGIAGAGGAGGDGTGGSPQLIARGGTIFSSSLDLIGDGVGGGGGGGGGDGQAQIGPDGDGGNGTGGSPMLQAFDGSPGVLSLGDVTISATGVGGAGTNIGIGDGGQVLIQDMSPDPAGLITFGNLTVDATGDPTSTTGMLTFDSGSGPITVTGNLDAEVSGDIVFDMDATGQLLVSGSTLLNAAQDIVVTHANNAGGAASLNSTGTVDFTAQGAIDAQAGSRIVSADTVSLRAEGDASVNDVAGAGVVTISAAGNVDVNNASVSGTPVVIALSDGSLVAGPVLLIEAGLDNPVGGSYDPAANAAVTGQLSSTGNIQINAGGNAVFEAGSNTVSDNGLTVRTGDDIIIAGGASLVSGANPATTPNANPFSDFNNLVLSAGSLDPLLTTPFTPFASIVSEGTINSNGFAIVMDANAIDALGGTVIGSSIAADINDAPADGIAQGDDDGLLSANCLQGNICLGNIQADNQILIGQNSNNDVIQLFIEQGTVNANDILITTRNNIVMGTDGIATTLVGTNSFSATSLAGDVNLLGAAITSDQITIDAAGSLLGTASLNSANDIAISVGQDLNAAAIITDGGLVGAGDAMLPAGSLYTVPGSLSIDLLSVGVGDINIAAGDTARIGTAIVPGTSIFLDGGTLAQLDSTNTALDVVLSGGAAVFGDVTATGNVGADVTGAIDLTAITAGNDIDLVAGTAVTGGDLVAGGTATVDGQSITLGTVDATSIALNSATDIFFNSLISPSAITLTAAGGTIGLNTGPGDIDSGGDVSLTAQTIGVGNIDAGGNVDVTTTAGALSVGDVTGSGVGSGISLFAAGAAGDIDAGTLITNSGDILLSAERDIALVSAANSAATPTAGSIALLAGGDIIATGTLNAGEDVAIRSLGNTALTTASAGDDVFIEADGSITIDGATSTGAGIDLFEIVFDTGNAGQPESIDFAAETLTGSNINLIGGIDVIVIGTLDAVDAINVAATGSPSIGNAISGGDTSVSGASVTFNNGTVGGDLALTATNGDIDGNGTISVAGGIALDATGSIGFGTLVAQNGDFTVAANNDIIFTAIDSAGLVDLSAGGLILGDRIDAVTSIALSANSSIDVDHAEAGTDFIASSGGNFTTGLNSIITGGDIVIAGDIVDLGNSTAGGLIDVTGTQIDFVNLIAGSTVTLLTDFNAPTGVTGSGNLNITGTNISAGAGASSLTSVGSIDVSGLLDILGSLTMDAFGNIAFGSAQVEGGSFIATAGGTIDLDDAEASDEIDFLAGEAITATGDISGASAVFLESSDASVSGVNIASGGDVDINAATTVTFTDITVAATSQVGITAGSDVTLNDIVAADNITIDSGGALAFVNLEAASAITLSSAAAMLGQSIDAGSTLFATAGTGGFTVDDIATGADVFVTSSDVISAGTIDAGTFASLTSTGAGNITVDAIDAETDVFITTGGAINVTALSGAQSGTGNVAVLGDEGVNIDTLTGIAATLVAVNGAVAVAGNADLSDAVTADGESVLLRSAGDLTASANATAGDVDVSAGGDLTTQGVSATGDVFLVSGGSVTVNAATVASDPSSTLAAGTQGVQQVTTTNGGNVTITAGTDILINSLVDAAGDLTMTAGDLIDLQATASGATVDTLSGDINIGIDGALGRSDLTSEISIATEGDIQLGGAAGTSMGFELDNDEFARVHSGGDVIISALGTNTGEGNINVSDLDVAVGQGTGTPTDGNIADSGGLFLEAGNDVNITGSLLMSGATAENVLAIDAGNLITIDAENATIRINDIDELPTGFIGMTADTIIAASADDLSTIPGLSIADAETLLGAAPAVSRPDGYILGSSVAFNVTNGVFIANSGATSDFADRRGIVAETVSISSSSNDVGIVINGVIDTLTGIDALSLVDVSAEFDPASTINGCVIADPASCVVIIDPIDPIDPTGGPNFDTEGGPLRDLIEEQIEEESPVSDQISSILVEFREDPSQAEDPLLDEPVTGAGNEDFWFGNSDEAGEDCDEDEDCSLEPAE